MCSPFLHSLCLRANYPINPDRIVNSPIKRPSSLWALWAQSPNDILVYVFCVFGALSDARLWARQNGTFLSQIPNNLLRTLFISTIISGIPDWGSLSWLPKTVNTQYEQWVDLGRCWKWRRPDSRNCIAGLCVMLGVGFEHWNVLWDFKILIVVICVSYCSVDISSNSMGCSYLQLYYVKWGTGLFISWLLDVGRLLAHWNLATITHLGNLLHIMNYMSWFRYYMPLLFCRGTACSCQSEGRPLQNLSRACSGSCSSNGQAGYCCIVVLGKEKTVIELHYTVVSLNFNLLTCFFKCKWSSEFTAR